MAITVSGKLREIQGKIVGEFAVVSRKQDQLSRGRSESSRLVARDTALEDRSPSETVSDQGLAANFGHAFSQVPIFSDAQRNAMSGYSGGAPSISTAPHFVVARDDDPSSSSADSSSSSTDTSSSSSSDPSQQSTPADNSSQDPSSSPAAGPAPEDPATCSQDPGGTAAQSPDNGECTPSPDPAPPADQCSQDPATEPSPTQDPTANSDPGSQPQDSDQPPGDSSGAGPMCTNDGSTPDGGAPANSSDTGAGGAPAASPTPDAPLLNGDGLTTGQNDALGTALGYAGMVPGPVGQVATVASLAQTAATAPTDPSDPNYQNDQMVTGLNAGLGVASLLGMEAAGPLGLVAAGGMALGHGAQAVGNEMIEQGMQKNPENFGPDPFDSLTAGQQGY